MKSRYALLALALVLIPFLKTSAQSIGVGPSDITNIVNFTVTPETPGPGQNVSISIEASGLDLDSATITWRINGSVIKSGQGIKNITVTNGPLGSQTTVSVDINSGGSVVSKLITLSSGDVDLLWQGETYAPAFYLGRTLWTNQSRVTLVAIPHVLTSNGAPVNAPTLIYRWTKDGTVLGSASGAGQDSLTFSDSILSLTTNIKVEVMTDRDTVVASASTNLTPQKVSLFVYEDNPLYGLMFNREVGSTFNLNGSEVSFSAIPLFFSTVGKNVSNLNYNWSSGAGGSETTNRVTYRTPEGGNGASSINLSASNTNKILQTATKNFTINFGGQNNL